MAAKVVDASVIAALLFGEPDAAALADRLADSHLVAPALLGFELANVCLKKIRRHPEQRTALTQSFALRTRFTVEEHAVDQDAVVRLAAQSALSAYDASYLWLARRLGAELVTLDRRLARVAAEGAP